jgi:hypothetical protein
LLQQVVMAADGTGDIFNGLPRRRETAIRFSEAGSSLTTREEYSMRRGHWGALAAVLVGGALQPTEAGAQTGFNGVITFVSARGAGKQDTFVQSTQGRKVRIDGLGPHRGGMIVDNDAKTLMIVDADKQQYMTMTEADAQQMQAMMAPMMDKMKQEQSKASGKFSFSKTGKTETVAGVPCEVWRGQHTGADGEKNEGEACVATGVGFALADLTFNNPMLQQHGPMHEQFEQYRQLVGDNKGILKATSVKNGKTTTELEAIKIERKAVGAETFAPPAGYKEIRMGDMMMQAHKAMQGHANPGKPDTTGQPQR